MEIDFGRTLMSLTGEPLEVMEKDKKVPLTLGKASAEALLAPLEKDKLETGQKKYEKWKLAGKIIEAKTPLDVTAEDVALLKDRIGLMYSAAVVGPAYEMLEGKDV